MERCGVILVTMYKNFIASNGLTTVFFVIISILVFLFLVDIIKLIEQVRTYYKSKSNEIIIKNNNKKVPLDKRIETSNQTISIVVFMIETECKYILRNYLSLGIPYETLQFDKDLKIVMNNVYTGIKKNVFLDEGLLFEQEWLMQFITKESTFNLLRLIQEYNSNIRTTRRKDGDSD